MKATKHDVVWNGRFFFVKKDSLPHAEQIPQEWVVKGRILFAYVLDIFILDTFFYFVFAVPQFEAVFPAGPDTETKIEES